jgi:hypothetical protein
MTNNESKNLLVIRKMATIPLYPIKYFQQYMALTAKFMSMQKFFLFSELSPLAFSLDCMANIPTPV